ncbi:hypothetical protein ACLOJK_033889 [Asimina triloba]
MAAEELSSHARGGLMVASNDTFRSFLISASLNPEISQSLRESASHLSHQPSIPYKTLRNIWSSSPPSSRPPLRHLFDGSDFIFTSLKPREKSEELKARLMKLAELAEKKAYDELVSDIKQRKGNDEPFSSYKDQIGFGSTLSFSPNWNAAGGVVGLVFAMLLETVLFIIRTSSPNVPSQLANSRQKKFL